MSECRLSVRLSVHIPECEQQQWHRPPRRRRRRLRASVARVSETHITTSIPTHPHRAHPSIVVSIVVGSHYAVISPFSDFWPQHFSISFSDAAAAASSSFSKPSILHHPGQTKLLPKRSSFCLFRSVFPLTVFFGSLQLAFKPNTIFTTIDFCSTHTGKLYTRHYWNLFLFFAFVFLCFILIQSGLQLVYTLFCIHFSAIFLRHRDHFGQEDNDHCSA